MARRGALCGALERDANGLHSSGRAAQHRQAFDILSRVVGGHQPVGTRFPEPTGSGDGRRGLVRGGSCAVLGRRATVEPGAVVSWGCQKGLRPVLHGPFRLALPGSLVWLATESCGGGGAEQHQAYEGLQLSRLRGQAVEVSFQAMFADRRRRVLDSIRGAAIVAAAPVSLRNNDVEQEYRQDSDMQYLTGFEEPESVLVLSKVHPDHRSILFVRPRDREREQWDGARAGVEGAKERFGVDAAFPIAELKKRLPEYLSDAEELVFELGKSRELDALVLAAITQVRARGRSVKAWPRTILHPDSVWHELRLVKDEAELGLMRRAAEISSDAHRAAMAAAAPGKFEYELDATLREVFRRNGAIREAYAPIVGSGSNATVLHYRENRRQMLDGELLLIDAGCEFEYYAADITRTFPVNGTFSEPQRAVYEAVLDSQLAAIEAVRPGSTIERVHQVALRTLVEGMVRIGLLVGAVDELIEKESYKRLYMHRTSHWLGMDVHDVGAYFVRGEARPFVPGTVLTIEPGIYVAPDDAESPLEFRGIGIRIEDDVLVTAAGYDVLTASAPKTVAELERACRQ